MYFREIEFSSKREYEEKTKPEYIKKIYLDYKEGRMSRDAYFYEIVAGINSFIKKKIAMRNRTVDNSYEELLNSTYIKINDVLDRYDPLAEKYYTPSTFFGYYMDEAQRDIANLGNKSRGFSPYYAKREKELNKRLTEMGYPTLDEGNYAPEELSEITGNSITSILGILNNRKDMMVSYDAMREYSDVAQSIYDNPEEAIIKDEKMRAIEEAFSTCTPLEKYFLLVFKCNDDFYIIYEEGSKPARGKETSEKRMIDRVLNDDTFYNMFKDELPPNRVITKKFIRTVLAVGEKKIRSQRNIKKYYDRPKITENDFVEQISEVDFDELKDIADKIGGTVNEDGIIQL